MVRLIFGWLCIAAGAMVWTAPAGVVESRTAISFGYLLLGAALVYFGRRARTRRRTTLSAAVDTGDAAALQERLSGGTDAKDARTALNKAAYKGQVEAVRALLSAGVDVNATWWDQTALSSAIHGGHPAVAEILLDHGADPSGKEGDRPVLIAVQRERLEILHRLIERGADVNVTDGDGKTPLMDAASAGRTEFVRTLLDAGADPNRENKWGETALYLAGGALMIGKKPEAAIELIDAGAAMSGRVFPRKLSLVGGVDRDHPVPWGLALNMRDKKGNSLLMMAAAKGKRRAVERLLSEAASAPPDADKEQAYELAKATGHEDIAIVIRENALRGTDSP